MPKTTLPSIDRIKKDFLHLKFKQSEQFCWSAREKTIYYDNELVQTEAGLFQLIHEIGHALSNHQQFESGIQLLKMESEAWQKAREIAENYNLEIPESLIERCLDSYRDWLHQRSTCPNCSAISIEVEPYQYHCFNCFQKWSVPSDQRTRCYRLKAGQTVS